MPTTVNATASSQPAAAAPQMSALDHFLDVLKTQQQIEDNNEATLAAAAREIEQAERKREMEGKPEDKRTSATSSSSSSTSGTQVSSTMSVPTPSLVS